MLAKKRRTRQTLRVLIGLFPELDAPGGVQRAGRHMAAVMTEFAASRGMECRLLSLNDSPELHRMTVSGREFVFTGCDRGKGRFALAALQGGTAQSEAGACGASESGASGAADEICGAEDEIDYLHAWRGSVGTAAENAAAGFAKGGFGAGAESSARRTT